MALIVALDRVDRPQGAPAEFHASAGAGIAPKAGWGRLELLKSLF